MPHGRASVAFSAAAFRYTVGETPPSAQGALSATAGGHEEGPRGVHAHPAARELTESLVQAAPEACASDLRERRAGILFAVDEITFGGIP